MSNDQQAANATILLQLDRIIAASASYDPRLDNVAGYSAAGKFWDAEWQAEAVARDDVAAGYTAYELIKLAALALADPFHADLAAERAAKLQQRWARSKQPLHSWRHWL